MATRLQGRLDEGDRADTYTLWRRPGRWRYELIVRGEGTLGLRVDLFGPIGDHNPDGAMGWRTIVERADVPAGSTAHGTAEVPEVPVGPGESAGWVQLRVRLQRTGKPSVVEYDFAMEGEA